MLKTAKRFWWRRQMYGLRKAAVLSGTEIWERYCDWRLGIETAVKISTEELAFDNTDYNHYGPCGYSEFARAIRHVPSTAADVLLDIGSGKGRALILAARHPFRRVIGIDLSQELNSIARMNVAKAKSRLQCQCIEIIDANATTYEIPNDVTVIHMYNPFIGEALRQTLEQIRVSLVSSPRTITLLFHNVTQVWDVLSLTPWLTTEAEIHSPRGRSLNYVIFKAAIENECVV